MKARNNKTGEIVTNFAFSKEFGTVSYIDSKGDLRFAAPMDREWTIFGEDGAGFDWESFKAKAAKDVLCAMIAGDKLHCDLAYETAVSTAINYADELIRQLKSE